MVSPISRIALTQEICFSEMVKPLANVQNITESNLSLIFIITVLLENSGLLTCKKYSFICKRRVFFFLGSDNKKQVLYSHLIGHLKVVWGWGVWLVHSVERVAFDLRVMRSSPMLGIKIIKKKQKEVV